MDYAAIKTAVLDRLGLPTTDGLITDTVLGRLINAAMQDLEADEDWPWLQASETIATVAGTGAYTPAATWARTRGLRVTTDEPMKFFSLEELDFMWPDPTTRGRPIAYTVEAEQLVLRPIPDAVYSLTHTFIKAPTDLSSSSDTPLMPSRFHHGIVEVAAALAARRQGSAASDGDPAMAAADRWRAKMRKDRRRQAGKAHVRVLSDW
jgi:hypothetical protein